MCHNNLVFLSRWLAVLRSITGESYANYVLILAFGMLGLALGFAVSSAYSEEGALQDDADMYWSLAEELKAGAPLLALSGPPRRVDVGYPLLLAIVFQLFGATVRLGQLTNVAMFSITSVLFFLALRKSMTLLNRALHTRAQFLLAGSFFLSPLFLTFSGKLFSEITAALGLTLLLCSILYLWAIDEFPSPPLLRGSWSALLILGSVLFVATKSAFFPLLIAYALAFAVLGKKRLAVLTMISIGICLPFQISAQRGGRGPDNFAVQIAKLNWSYSEIAASAVYNYSDTLGKTLLPSYAGLLQQNPRSETVVDDRNAYVVAVGLREQGFSYLNGFLRIAEDPIKYLVVATATLPAMIAVEGIYSAVGEMLSSSLRVFLWAVLKQALSLTLWFGLFMLVRNQRKNRLVYVLALPIIYFILVYANFSIEQRWFFPLLPLLWLLGLSYFCMLFERRESKDEVLSLSSQTDTYGLGRQTNIPKRQLESQLATAVLV